MTTENKFYVYIHYRKSDGKPFYIGKGNGKRAGNRSSRNQYWKKIVNKHGCFVKIVCKNMSESLAFKLETKLIAFYSKKYELANMSLGGEGSSGPKHTIASRAKLRKFRLGKSLPQETRTKISLANSGKSPTVETRSKIGKALSVRIRCIETGQVFSSLAQAAAILKIESYDISKVLNGYSGRKSVKGFTFERVV